MSSTQGETEQRLYALVAWRETPFYTERERAALAWTEVSDGHVPGTYQPSETVGKKDRSGRASST